MKKFASIMFGSAMLTVLVLGITATAPDSAQAFQYFETCPLNACVSPTTTAGVCDRPNGQTCLVKREAFTGTYCLSTCF